MQKTPFCYPSKTHKIQECITTPYLNNKKSLLLTTNSTL